MGREWQREAGGKAWEGMGWDRLGRERGQESERQRRLEEDGDGEQDQEWEREREA